MKDLNVTKRDRLAVEKRPEKSPTMQADRNIRIAGRTLHTTRIFDMFWKYAAERQSIEIKRRAGEPQPWTADPTLQAHKFCSVFRVADRGSQFLVREVIEKGSQKHEDIVFRVLLYNIFTRAGTFKLLAECCAPLTWATYDHAKYSRVLHDAYENGVTLYTGAFQKPAPSLGFGIAFMNHLVLLEVMMGERLPQRLAEAQYMRDVFDILNAYPGMGDFVAFQLLLDLSYTPVLNFSEHDFVVAGVGAAKGLKKCFKPESEVIGIEEDIIRWMVANQEHEFAQRGLYFTGLLTESEKGKGRMMSLVDVEHTLCEVHKYSRIAVLPGKSSGCGRRFTPTSVLDKYPALPKAWSHPARKIVRRAPGRHVRVDKQYVVQEVLDKRINKEGEAEYLVDWLGYSEEYRSWVSGWSLKEDAPQAVQDYERSIS